MKITTESAPGGHCKGTLVVLRDNGQAVVLATFKARSQGRGLKDAQDYANVVRVAVSSAPRYGGKRNDA